MKAPPPPNFRDAPAGSAERCANCKMFDPAAEICDATEIVCWGFGNRETNENKLCDDWAPEPADETDSARGGQSMDTQEQRLAAYLEHAREKYDEVALRTMAEAATALDMRVAAMDEQQRATYEDTRDMLSSAIAEKFRGDGDNDADDWTYVDDFTDEWVVFCQNGAKLQVPYTVDGDAVTLGETTPVREVTTYVPVEAKSALSNPATPKRAFSSLVEQPPSHTAEVEMRMDDDAGDSNIAHFAGYASTTGVAYSVRDWLGEYDETMQPGAFAKTLREQGDVPMLFNHDGVPLASTGSATSRLAEDKVGLRNEAELDRRDALTNSVCVQLQRKVLGKMSFSFRAVKDTWNDTYDNRGVTEAALYDTSIVTYPANPTTSGELVDAMRSALGREGRSLWLADSELSVRSALPVFIQARDGAAEVDDESEAVLERALRALAHADEVVCRSLGRQHGRARTFLVAQAMLELRAGKTLSSANEKLLNSAMTALASADKHHQKASVQHVKAADAVGSVLGSGEQGEGQNQNKSSSAGKPSGDGKSTGTPPGSGNPISPQDGAGPRAASLKLKRQREAELRNLRRQ